jgi:hypothetical protein
MRTLIKLPAPRNKGCRAERGIIEHGEMLLNCTAGRVRGQTRGTLDTVPVTRVGLDQAGVDGKAFATNQALVDAALQNGLEQPP